MLQDKGGLQEVCRELYRHTEGCLEIYFPIFQTIRSMTFALSNLWETNLFHYSVSSNV